MYEVRQSICVAGVNRDAVLAVKTLVAGVTSQPLPLESFHVKRRSDVADGAMLVPKVVLAGAHQPGQKFLNRTPAGDGQLDFLYDEVCKIGGKSTVPLASFSPRVKQGSRRDGLRRGATWRVTVNNSPMACVCICAIT